MPGEIDIESPPPNFPGSQHASHTFSQSPSVAQLSAYLIMTLQIIVYFTCLWPLYANFIHLGLYVGSGAAMVCCAVVCSLTNPTDPMVYHYKWSKCNKKIVFDTDFTQSCYCEHCESFCAPRSKHCRVCNRCTSDFDHHCIWINNCVGGRNYRSFFLLIVFTFCHLSAFIVGGALMSASLINQQRIDYSRAVPVWVLMAVLAILVVFLLHLIALHVYLLARGISTYEFLHERRRQEEAKKRQQRALALKRQISNDNTNEDERSNAQIKITQSSNASNKVQQMEVQKPPVSDELKNYQNQGESKAQEQEYKENMHNAEEMPTFMRQNRSFKLIFGSDQVDAPTNSRKKLPSFSL